MVIFDLDKCIGCGMCAGDCLPQAIEIQDKKARFLKDHNCMECGHCIAICPRDAVSIDTLDMGEVESLKGLPIEIDPKVYLDHLKARRSIRSFKADPLTDEDMEMILDAGRFSPTGGNRQNVAYHIYTESIPELRDLIIDELKVMADDVLAKGGNGSWYPGLWEKMHASYEEDGTDRLFFGAPTVIVVSSDSPQAAIIASAHMETMVYSLGLGMLYSGFAVRAIAHSATIQEFLELKDGYQAWTVLVIGHPKVHYQRTVPRNPVQVRWN